MMDQPREKTGLPRVVLLTDGVFCGASGAITLLGARPISEFLGLDGAAILIALGAGLLVYGAWLAWEATRRPVERGLVLLVALLNIAWVAGSVLILLAGVPALSSEGGWAVGILAVIVMLFAEAQLYTFWRMR